ncbi:MAG: hypothetical protein FJY56_15720 [Betaproteobacteria bacterium]|nr:hypothetical protein [Betaproteobacteria bacterium]
MKLLAGLVVVLVLAGIATAEFTHHLSEGHELTAVSAFTCADPLLAKQEAKALLREHLLTHQR